MKTPQTKKMNCSICTRFKNGTTHSLHKIDAVGAWYICDKCQGTLACIPKGDA